MINIQDIKNLLDQFQEQSIHELLDTVCMIDECNRLDKIFEKELLKEGLSMDDLDIEDMIITDIQYWDEVYKEWDNYYWDYDDYDDYDYY